MERGPKTAGAKATETDKKKTYRRSTIHQSEVKNEGLSRFKRNISEANTSIKTKNTNLHIAGRTGALAAGAVTEQVDGGQEVSQAAYLAYEASRPVTGTASKGAELFRKKAAEQAKKRIKKVEAGRKLAKKSAKKAAKDTAKTVAKETAKTTTKVATKTATKAAATAAGTAVAPGVGTAVGMAAGYAAGVSIEAKDAKATNRSRKIKFFLDKMKVQENQTDSFAKLVKDLVVRKAIMWVKVVAPIIGLHLDASIDKLDNLAMNVQFDKEKRMENTKEKEQVEPDKAKAERVETEIVYAPMVATDDSIRSEAYEVAGISDVMAEWKGGKADRYARAVKMMDKIKTMQDTEKIKEHLRSYINRVEMGSESENEFLRHEITKAHKKNSFIVQALGEMSRSEQDTLFGNGAEPEGGTTAE